MGEQGGVRSAWRRLASSLGLALIAGLAVPGIANAAGVDDYVPGDARPNLILVNTDDQAVETFIPAYMPRTFELFAKRGTIFTEAIVATPLCCPSREAVATGQYGHNNGVLRNTYGDLIDKRNVLPAWLKRAGYKTIHVGRFANGYENRGRKGKVAPGWTTWRTTLAPRAYYDYKLTRNNGKVRYDDEDDDHLTDVLSRVAAKQITRKARGKRPFYLQLDHFAPHYGDGDRTGRCPGSAVPGPLDENRYVNGAGPQGGSVNEADITDKPDFMQTGLEPLSIERMLRITRDRNCARAAIHTLDRGIGKIHAALKRSKALRNTVFIFTSDNGYIYGQHRIGLQKHWPYEESLRVPMLVRMPRSYGAQPATSDAAVANIDLAPTLLDLADAEPCKPDRCRVMDGRSFAGETLGVDSIPDGRAIAIELGQRGTPREALVCGYSGLRTTGETWVHHFEARVHRQDECGPWQAYEHYDLSADPFQRENLYPAPPASALEAAQAALAARATSLSTCSGVAGRDPETPGVDFCE